jgi:penicillin-binding protein 1B
VPKVCRDAVLAAEDQRFFLHPGVDPLALVRAVMVNVRAGGAEQGGSTLTQQLVKNTFLTPQRTIGRKLREAIIAVLLELHTSKEDILGRYLASVYLGTDGGLPVHGFAHGAMVHLGKPLGSLDAGDCAVLAGMIRSPNRLAPRRHRDEARARRDEVLRLMIEHDMLDAQTGEKAMAQPIAPAPPRERSVGALYVADQVQRELKQIVPEVAASPGLAVYTSIDGAAQREAEHAVRHGLETLEKRRPPRDEPLQAALVAIDPETGMVRALVGGRDYRTSALDHAVRMRRQPGSTFKPFVYLAAVDPSRSGMEARNVVSRVEDRPLALDVDGRTWTPANYEDEYFGQVPLEEALARSLNTATVRLALDVGIGRVIATARDLGITSDLPPVPALALGAGEVSLLELTSAYAVIASGGLQRPPALVTAVASGEGEVLYVAQPQEKSVIDPAVAYLMTHMMERVIDVGTGDGVRRLGYRGAAAGKTGTTNDTRDAWFVGWTPDLVAGVWVGYDKGGSTGLTGAVAALPIWTSFIRATAGPTPPTKFPVPQGIVWREVDPTSGLLATPSCPASTPEPFLSGSEPPITCDRHRPTFEAIGDKVEDTARDAGKAIESTGRSIGRWFRDLFD